MKFLEVAAKAKRGRNWDAIRDEASPGVIAHDLRILPIPTIRGETYDGVYSEHFIEHLDRGEGIRFFDEMYRVMKPGAIIRTVWPPRDFVDWLRSDADLTEHPFVREYFQLYILQHHFAPAGNQGLSRQEQCALGLLYQNGEHKYLWGEQELMDTLLQLGFQDVRVCRYQESSFFPFRNIETKDYIREYHSTVVEARKPQL